MHKVAISAALFAAAIISVAGSQKAHAESIQKTDTNPKIVKVVRGDSLSKLAEAHGSTYPRIYYANKNIKHPDLIYADEELRIPNSDEPLEERPMPADAQVPTEPVQPKRQPQNASATKPKQRISKAKPSPAPIASATSANSGDVWDRLAACESGGNWSTNTGNGYFGGLQFTLSTWQAVGGSGYPHQASKAEQIKRAQILQARSGWNQWPACSAKLGL